MSPDPQLGTCEAPEPWHQGTHAFDDDADYPCFLWRRVGVPEPEACGVPRCINRAPTPDQYASCFYDGSPCQTIESRLAEVTRQRDEAIRLLQAAVDAYDFDDVLATAIENARRFLAAHSGQEQTGDTQR